MKNNLTTTKETSIVLAKCKSLMGITAKILSGSKALATAKSKDLATTGKLMWEEVEDPDHNEMDWYDAMEYAKNLRQGGYDDWRLPTIEELKAVVRECGGINVSVNGNWEDIRPKNMNNESYHSSYEEKGFVSNWFECYYWSSTTYNTGLNVNAWYVNFLYGYHAYNYGKSSSFYVRCVRAGQ